MRIIHLHELAGGGRLGRHVEHDPRSRGFAAAAPASPLVSRAWKRHCAPFNQGGVGACTGNAMAGVLMTEPFFTPGRNLTEADALRLYELATRLDKIAGHYPPEDTGSSGLAVAKAAHRSGYVKSYAHAFGLQHALAALGHGPVLLGIPWFAGFDTPRGPHAELVIAGGVRGGHEVELLEIDIAARMVRGCNSWGAGWGDGGYFSLTFDTLDELLAQDGDVVCPVPA